MKKILRTEELMTTIGEMIIFDSLNKREREPVRRIKIMVIHIAQEFNGKFTNRPVSEKQYRKKYYDIAQDLGCHDVRRVALTNYDTSDKNFSSPESTIIGAFKTL